MAIHEQQYGRVASWVLHLCCVGVLVMAGCSDNTHPVGQTTSYVPVVAGHWVGIAREQRELTVNDFVEYKVVADFQQEQAALGGYWVWTVTRITGNCSSPGGETRCRFAGSIDAGGNMIIQDTSVVFVNWRGDRWTHSSPLAATLSPRGDTITGGGYEKIATGQQNSFVMGKR